MFEDVSLGALSDLISTGIVALLILLREPIKQRWQAYRAKLKKTA